MNAAARAAKQAAAGATSLAARLFAYGAEAIPEVQDALIIARFMITILGRGGR